ncbi:MAG: hypothetical protein AAF664_07715, partial [Planctomycetota bacterium]
MSPIQLLHDILIVVLALTAQADSNKSPATSSDKTTKLSVAPLDQVIYPETRPAWLDQESIDDRAVVQSLRLHRSEAEAKAEFIALVRAYVAEHLEELSKQSDVDFYRIDDKTLLKDFITEAYQGTAQRGGETLHEMGGQFVFPEQHRQAAANAWDNNLVGDRMFVVAMAGGGLTVS